MKLTWDHPLMMSACTKFWDFDPLRSLPESQPPLSLSADVTYGWSPLTVAGVGSNVAAALVRTQGPNKIDHTFCLLQTCLTSNPVLHWAKGRCGLPEKGTGLAKQGEVTVWSVSRMCDPFRSDPAF